MLLKYIGNGDMRIIINGDMYFLSDGVTIDIPVEFYDDMTNENKELFMEVVDFEKEIEQAPVLEQENIQEDENNGNSSRI